MKMKSAILLLLFSHLFIVIVPPSAAAPNDGLTAEELEDYEDLLEQGLQIFEIDAELTRIQQIQSETAQQLQTYEQLIEQEKQKQQEKKEQVGRILHAYYVGDRIGFLSIIFNVSNFSELWTAIDRLQLILQSDQSLIDEYLLANKKMEQYYQELADQKDVLDDIQARFLKQRAHLTALQKDLDARLAAKEEHGLLIKENIQKVTEKWKEEGLPLFHSYFSALTQAMRELPSLLDKDSRYLSTSGSKLVFKMSDSDLNTFLRSQNDKFEDMEFTFMDDLIIAKGREDDVELSLEGKYILAEEPENHIAFEIGKLAYNGYDLPDTTVQQLNEQYDLGIYPKKVMSFIEATDVQTEDGLLKVFLALNLGFF